VPSVGSRPHASLYEGTVGATSCSDAVSTFTAEGGPTAAGLRGPLCTAYRPHAASHETLPFPRSKTLACASPSVTYPEGRIRSRLSYRNSQSTLLSLFGPAVPKGPPKSGLRPVHVVTLRNCRAHGQPTAAALPIFGCLRLLIPHEQSLPHCLDNRLTDGAEVVSPTAQKHYSSASGTRSSYRRRHVCRAGKFGGLVRARFRGTRLVRSELAQCAEAGLTAHREPAESK
jgi:hypothetical protein